MKNLSISFNILKLLPSLIALAEAEFGHGSGAEKKAAVIDVATSLAVAGGSAVAANNPKYADAIGALTDALAKSLFPTHSDPTPAP